MFLTRTSCTICASIALPLVAAGGIAAEEAGAAGSRIEELTVMATRVERSIGDLPVAVSVIDQAQIQRGRQQLGLDEALNRVPGLFSQKTRSFA